jgi:hypothetical protein
VCACIDKGEVSGKDRIATSLNNRQPHVIPGIEELSVAYYE